MKKQKDDLWIKICLLPLIIGFALVYANMSIKIFNLIGWALLLFGIITGSGYLLKLYKANKEKVWKILKKLKLVKKDKGQLSDVEVDKKMGEEGECI